MNKFAHWRDQIVDIAKDIEADHKIVKAELTGWKAWAVELLNNFNYPAASMTYEEMRSQINYTFKLRSTNVITDEEYELIKAIRNLKCGCDNADA